MFSLVELVWCDLQKRLQSGEGCVVHQQVDGAHVLQGRLRGPPVCQVHTYRGDGGTLRGGAQQRGWCRAEREGGEGGGEQLVLIHTIMNSVYKIINPARTIHSFLGGILHILTHKQFTVIITL